MKLLTQQNYQKARNFIIDHARPLEKNLYLYYFEDGPHEGILQELKMFQNPDGGFGHALEPDFRAPESSALATSVALEILQDLPIPAIHPLVQNVINYLLNTYNLEKEVWRIIPETGDASPHAPWWNQDGLETTFQDFLSNPRPELLGYLFTYNTLVPSGFQAQLLSPVLSYLESLPDRISGNDLACYLRLYASKHLPHEAQERLRIRLEKMIAASVETDPEKWGSYCFKPLWAVASPESPFAELIPDALEKNLDYEIDMQDEDGSWKPNWTWGDLYPDVWEIAQREWSGILTLRSLQTLKKFGRWKNH